MRYRSALLLCLALGLCRSAYAQSAPPAPWFEPQTITMSARYRFVQTNGDQTTADQLQFKDAFRARFNLDRDRRVSIHVGAFSGSSFTSSWDATGIGSGQASADTYVKQLFASVAPMHGLELQFGGLYINHGESTEITSYDDDGYVMGERVTLRRPAQAYFDEISLTRAALGSPSMPGVFRRLHLLDRQNYWQAAVVKHVGSAISASADVTDVAGVATARAAVAVHFRKSAPLSTVRFEQYRRFANRSAEPVPVEGSRYATGFAVVGERPITSHVRLQAGYADIDAAYGGLNADRIQRGKRVFAIAAIPIAGPLSAQLFATQAFTRSYSITNRTRFDAVITYDLLAAFQKRSAEGHPTAHNPRGGDPAASRSIR